VSSQPDVSRVDRALIERASEDERFRTEVVEAPTQALASVLGREAAAGRATIKEGARPALARLLDKAAADPDYRALIEADPEKALSRIGWSRAAGQQAGPSELDLRTECYAWSLIDYWSNEN